MIRHTAIRPFRAPRAFRASRVVALAALLACLPIGRAEGVESPVHPGGARSAPALRAALARPPRPRPVRPG